MLRGAIGFVPQEPFLFSATLAQNIAFGARGEQDTADRVEQAAAIARLDKDMADFPRGYDTMIGERGITLSGGQKQRTAIARALDRSTRRSWSSTMPCRPWTPIRRKRFSRGFAA